MKRVHECVIVGWLLRRGFLIPSFHSILPISRSPLRPLVTSVVVVPPPPSVSLCSWCLCSSAVGRRVYVCAFAVFRFASSELSRGLHSYFARCSRVGCVNFPPLSSRLTHPSTVSLTVRDRGRGVGSGEGSRTAGGPVMHNFTSLHVGKHPPTPTPIRRHTDADRCILYTRFEGLTRGAGCAAFLCSLLNPVMYDCVRVWCVCVELELVWMVRALM
uniref:Uncharacterized protein n=1 Tax=Leishmania guyanensis TaxID=5670 RepID=A0A1E1J0P2_LEIGU|nr:Hypothetical protein BN36_2845760 [Leishmania guyanensis]